MQTANTIYDFLNLGGMVGYAPPRLVRIRNVLRKAPTVLSESEVIELIRVLLLVPISPVSCGEADCDFVTPIPLDS